jgi:hypothetical protein
MCSLFTVPARQAARHTARQRFPLIRHLIRQRKPLAHHCSARLHCAATLSIPWYARGRNSRLQICHFLAVSLLCLSLITTNSLSNHPHLLVLLCLHSFRHSLLLLSTHSDILSHFHLYSLRHSFLHHNHHGHQLGSSSWLDLRRTGMLHRNCLRSGLLLQPLHPIGWGGRRAQRETLVSSSPSNSAYDA